jgi:adenylate cyclase
VAKKRSKIFETKRFAFVIAAVVVGLLLLIQNTLYLLDDFETRVVRDFFFNLKPQYGSSSIQMGVVQSAMNPKRSDAVNIIGIDKRALDELGRWPFPRSTHALLLDKFTNILDQSKRENSILLDIFFNEPSDPFEDAALLAGIKKNGKVFLETTLLANIPSFNDEYEPGEGEMPAEMERLYFEEGLGLKDASLLSHGSFRDIKGNWQSMAPFFLSDSPMPPFALAAKGYGHATYVPDSDNVYRKAPLIARYMVAREELLLSDFSLEKAASLGEHEQYVWVDRANDIHPILGPLDDETSLRKLQEEIVRAGIPISAGVGSDRLEDNLGNYFVLRYKSYFMPSITLRLSMEYFNVSPSDLDIELGNRIVIKNPMRRVRAEDGAIALVPYFVGNPEIDPPGSSRLKPIKEIVIPIDENGAMRINYLGSPSKGEDQYPATFPVSSYANYIRPPQEVSSWPSSSSFEDKIMLVGMFTTGAAADEKPTPLGLMYGVEVHANAINTIVMNDFLYDSPWWITAILIAVFALVIAFTASRLNTMITLPIVLTLVVGYLVACYFAFIDLNLQLNFTLPAFTAILAYIAIIAYRTMTEEKDKRQLKETFKKYVGPKVVDLVAENPPELGGVDKQLTVLFSDIRGYTTLSENMSPQELVNHLNVYLTAMTDLIFEYSGTLDKYVGDEIMCFWGAPLPQKNHAELACKCALRQMQVLHELNDSWPPQKRINIGIGLNSGIMTVGNMGSKGRMNYTLMGDNVNLGARLEGTNKAYGTGIIVSEYTYGLVKDKFIFRELDNIRVKGKNKPVLIYELVDVAEGESVAPPSVIDA